jgi:hypothetical protein
MRQPFWKTILSHFHDIRIECHRTSTRISVNLSRGRYQLSAHAVYSYAGLYGNFRRVFQKLRWDLLPGDKVLILGLGLGSIRLCWKEISSDVSIHCR